MASQALPAAVADQPRRRLGVRYADALIAAGIFVCCLVVYLANRQGTHIGDTIPNSLLGLNVAEHGSLNFNAFNDSYLHGRSSPFAVQYWFTQSRGGDLVSAYPIGAGMVALPLQALEAFALRLSYHSAGLQFDITSAAFDPTRQYLEKLNASIIAAAAVVGAYYLLRTRFDRRTATLAALLFAFATSVWSTASQAMWQHGPLLLVVLLAARLVLVRCGGRRQVIAWALAGILFGFAFGVRPTGLAYGLVMACFLPRLGWSRAAGAAFVAGLVGVAGAWALWAHSVYGSLTAGYRTPGGLYRLTPGQGAEGVAGLLVSPSRGILIYTPLVVLALYVILGPLRRRFAADPVAMALLIAAALITVSYCFDETWFGGWSYGPRMLSDTLAGFVLPLGYMLEWAAGTRWRIAALAVVASWSLFTQFVGAVGQPGSDWNAVPSGMAQRLWDWHDNPIRRQFNGTVRRFAMTPVDRPTYLTRLRGQVVTIGGKECRPGTTVTLPAAGHGVSAELRNIGPSRWFGYLDSPRRGEVRLDLALQAAGDPVHQVLYVADAPAFGRTAQAVGLLSSALRSGTYTARAQLIANGLGPMAGSGVTCTALVT